MTFYKLLACMCVVAHCSLAALAQTEVSEEYTVDRANAYIQQHENSVNKTYRLQYHFMAPVGWINDPNGFIYFRGEYHLFYQYNPYNTYSNKIHWGHAKSKDLVYWEHLDVALAPDQEYDKEGVFSGSAIEKDGKLYVMYTGNSAQGQVQCIAVSDDGIHFQKISENPVLDAKDLPSNAIKEDFRDPKVFKRGELYYVVLVSKTLNNTGQALLYVSSDLIKWKFKSILLEGTSEQGIMWECPDLYELDGKDVLVLSPIQIPKNGNDYLNIDSVVEFIGSVNWEEGKMNVVTARPKELDHGLDFYATQSLIDDKGRRIVIAWMAMWGRNFPTSSDGWVGSMTLPRELHIKDGYLTQTPIQEISNYYGGTVKRENVNLTDGVKEEFDGISGEVGVLNAVVNLQGASLFTIELRANENEKTVLSYNTSSQEITLDRTLSGVVIIGDENPDVYSRTVEAPLVENRLTLQVFLDKSSVEVFVNDGKETMTETIFPTKDTSSAIRFSAQGQCVIESVSFTSIITAGAGLSLPPYFLIACLLTLVRLLLL